MALPITTADELLRAGDISRCELVRGRLVMMNPTAGRIAGILALMIGSHVPANSLGAFGGAETGFLLSRDPDTVRAPDVAFVGAGREPATTGRFFPGAPDLAVEVLSPDDRPREVREKVAEWLAAGTGAVWVVDSRLRTVTVRGPSTRPRVFREADALRGGDVLPGFAAAVRDIFA